MATRIKEKAIARAENKDKRPRAEAKYIRITSSKAGVVLDLIRGKKYLEAVSILANMTNASAIVIKKVIDSAAANAENNMNLDKANLYVAECYANAGPTMKRFAARGRGKMFSVLKRSTHITVILDSVKA